MRIAHAVVRVGGLIRVHLSLKNSSALVCRTLALEALRSGALARRRSESTQHWTPSCRSPHRTQSRRGAKAVPPTPFRANTVKVLSCDQVPRRGPRSPPLRLGASVGAASELILQTKRRMHVESAFMIGWQRLRVRCLSPSLCACMTLNYDTRVVRWAREGLRGDSEARVGAGLRRTARMRMSQS